LRTPLGEEGVVIPTLLSGPLALEVPGGIEWAVWLRFYADGGESFVEWHGGHHHCNRLTGPLENDGPRLLIPTDSLGTLVLRELGPSDTWGVSDGQRGGPAWEVFQRGWR
jgi:hypothetical protein